MEFEADGSRILPAAVFESVPEKSLFTLGMDAPHSWMVRSFALGAIVYVQYSTVQSVIYWSIHVHV